MGASSLTRVVASLLLAALMMAPGALGPRGSQADQFDPADAAFTAADLGPGWEVISGPETREVVFYGPAKLFDVNFGRTPDAASGEGGPFIAGARIVVSRAPIPSAELDRSADTVARDLKSQGLSPLPSDGPAVGEEARWLVAQTFYRGSPATAHVVVFRSHSALAMVNILGFQDQLDQSNAVALARIVEDRLSPLLAPIAPRRYVSQPFGFAMQFPAWWEIHENFLGVAVSGRAPQEPDTRFQSNCNVFVESVPGNITLEEYVQIGQTKSAGMLAGLRERERGSATLAGVPTTWVVNEGQPEGQPLMLLNYILIARGRGYNITCAAGAEQFPQYRAQFEEIARSFSLE